MEVSDAKFTEIEMELTGRKEMVPCTYFSLTSHEQGLYDDFRRRHDELKLELKKLNHQGNYEEVKSKGEEEVSDIFLKLVIPYFKKQNLNPVSCFTWYGNKKFTTLHMPTYLLSKEGESPEKPLKLYIDFFTEREILSCRSHLCYDVKTYYERTIFYDLFERVTKKLPQDGIPSPLVSFRGSFIDFASTDFTFSLMQLMKTIFDKAGKERMNELKVLYQSYQEEARTEADGNSNAKIKKEAFKSAYASSLEITLLESGLV